jgi:hypothetical protein
MEFITESEKSRTAQGREFMEVAVRVGFRVWSRNVSQVEPSALVRCRGEFASSLTTNFLVACVVLSREDAAELVNDFPHLIFDPLQ